MRRFMSFIVGAICGAAVGAVVALIFTPASGEELVGDMRNKWNEVLDEAQKAQRETQERLEKELGRIHPDNGDQ